MPAPKGNQYAKGHGYGRPRKFNDPEDMQDCIDGYFEYIKGEFIDRTETDAEGNKVDIKEWIRRPEPITWTGLAIFLGFVSRQSMTDYANNEIFSDTIKRALARVEQSYEKLMIDKGTAGSIFALKNFGWKDQKEVKTDMSIEAKNPFEGMSKQEMIEMLKDTDDEE